MREWLIALGILVVVAIVLDGLRRLRNVRRDSIQLSINMGRSVDRTDFDDFDDDELPSGSARVVTARSASQRNAGADEPELVEDDGSIAFSDTVRRREIDFDQVAPMLMDVREDHQRIEPGFSNDIDEDIEASESELPDEAPLARGVKNAAPVFDSATAPLGFGESEVLGKPRVYERPADQPPPRREAPGIKPSKPVIKAKEERIQQQVEQKPQQLALEEVIIISVMSRDRSGFPGAALLETLLSAGLRYGHRNIFHYYTGDEREEESLYSAVNIVKPGTFDLNNMESFHTPGISLFLTLPLPGSAMEAFDSMLATARLVAEKLNGELRDENRSVMTGQTIEHSRQRIRDFDMQCRLRAR
ncbi:MAG TPA: cell division protein ZipA [Pseudomonadales bacterium]|nr:cell division protein ZipA [Pseudomonadales bacterium]